MQVFCYKINLLMRNVIQAELGITGTKTGMDKNGEKV
jgi:hypothetical protein